MPVDRLGARREAVAGALESEGLQGLIVTHLPNVRYLTGFTGSSGVLLLAGEEAIFFSDARYRTQAVREVQGATRIEIVEADLWAAVWRTLEGGERPERLGFEAHAVTARQARDFADASSAVGLEPVVGLVERFRARKDPEEVGAIREAARLATEALERVLESVRVGQREIDIAARLEYELRTLGSEWHPFPTIVASGPRSALPHGRTSAREVAAGEFLLLDFGACIDGYCADITRTVVVGGAADERQRAVYEVVREAQRTARDEIRAGMTGRQADALARSVIEARGFGEAFGHSLGHGLGLEVHEDPRVSRANDEPLPSGSVVTVEPGIYLPDWGGVRLEDDVFLEDDRAELLSDGNTELRQLG